MAKVRYVVALAGIATAAAVFTAPAAMATDAHSGDVHSGDVHSGDRAAVVDQGAVPNPNYWFYRDNHEAAPIVPVVR